MRAQRVRAGDLRTPLKLGKPTLAQDTTGAQTVDPWVEADVFGDVQPASGREWISGGLLRDQVDVVIIMRRMPDVPDATWRVRDPHAVITYTIVAVLVNQKQNVIELACKSTVGNVSDGR